MISSKILEKENWISFKFFEYEIFLSQEEVDNLALDVYKWVLKLNDMNLKNNKVFMKRVKDAKEKIYKD